MWKFISAAWKVWSFIAPRYVSIMRIVDEVKQRGLKNEEARKEVFQKVTDLIQSNGLSKIPDNILNAGIELCYQVYVSRTNKA